MNNIKDLLNNPEVESLCKAYAGMCISLDDYTAPPDIYSAFKEKLIAELTPKIEPLLITEDGVEIFDKDTLVQPVHALTLDLEMCITVHHFINSHSKSFYKVFYKQEKALEYIAQHKKKYSLMENQHAVADAIDTEGTIGLTARDRIIQQVKSNLQKLNR